MKNRWKVQINAALLKYIMNRCSSKLQPSLDGLGKLLNHSYSCHESPPYAIPGDIFKIKMGVFYVSWFMTQAFCNLNIDIYLKMCSSQHAHMQISVNVCKEISVGVFCMAFQTSVWLEKFSCSKDLKQFK